MNERLDDDELPARPLPPPFGASDVLFRHQYDKIRKYYLQTNPSLWEKIEAQAAQFAVVARTYIDPALQEVAAEASRRGWYSRIVYDDPHTVTGQTTPGIRLFLSRTHFNTELSPEALGSAFILWFGNIDDANIVARVDANPTDPNVKSTYLKLPIEYNEISHDRFKGAMLELLEAWTEF